MPGVQRAHGGDHPHGPRLGVAPPAEGLGGPRGPARSPGIRGHRREGRAVPGGRRPPGGGRGERRRAPAPSAPCRGPRRGERAPPRGRGRTPGRGRAGAGGRAHGESLGGESPAGVAERRGTAPGEEVEVSAGRGSARSRPCASSIARRASASICRRRPPGPGLDHAFQHRRRARRPARRPRPRRGSGRPGHGGEAFARRARAESGRLESRAGYPVRSSPAPGRRARDRSRPSPGAARAAGSAAGGRPGGRARRGSRGRATVDGCQSRIPARGEGGYALAAGAHKASKAGAEARGPPRPRLGSASSPAARRPPETRGPRRAPRGATQSSRAVRRARAWRTGPDPA